MPDLVLPLVRPMAVSCDGGAALPLDVMVEAMVRAKVRGAVLVHGGPGSGRSSAIEFLRRRFGDAGHVRFCDEPIADRALFDGGGLLIFLGPTPRFTGTEPDDAAARGCEFVRYRDGRVRMHFASGEVIQLLDAFGIAPWGLDEWIEYLLARHGGACASVMRRMQVRENARLVGGSPLLAGVVLDAFAADEALTSAEEAVRRFAEHAAGWKAILDDARTIALNFMLHEQPKLNLSRLRGGGIDPRLASAVSLPAVQCLLASDRVIENLVENKWLTYFVLRFDPLLIRAVGNRLREMPTAYRTVLAILGKERMWEMHSTAGSLAVAADLGWVPDGATALNLERAELAGAKWGKTCLAGHNLEWANLAHADLRGADMDGGKLECANLSRADLERATFRKANASLALFDGARLVDVDGRDADLGGATFLDANLEGASLVGADLMGCDLTRARMVRTNLSNAELVCSKIDETEFTSACMVRAKLTRLDLRSAALGGADLTAAELQGCRMDGLMLPGAKLRQANLRGADLTGTCMPHGDLSGADLREAGLAEVEWEYVDLSGADLRGASFHAGSSRSGLVGSPIACEGSKSGFYTDEFEEQLFRAPEEIRKANLRGADLRGALVEATDFYLVDLRDAKYDEAQAEHFRRCGAILHARVAD